MVYSKRNPRPSPSQQRLRELFDFDRETGLPKWRYRPEYPDWWNRKFAGKVAGCIATNGYRVIRIDNVLFLAHRLIWKWLHDEEPPEIDHENGDRADNREINLKASTVAKNAKNAKLRSDNTSGHVGVLWHKAAGKWAAHIALDQRNHHLGLFDNIEDAVAARKAAEKLHGFSELHGAKDRAHYPRLSKKRRVELGHPEVVIDEVG